MHQLDLTAQRVLCLHVQHLEAEIQRLMAVVDEAQKRIAICDAVDAVAAIDAEKKDAD